jgi:hypothetical protein
MSEDITTSGEGASPSEPSHLPDPAQWPGNEGQESRELTDYEQAPGERDAPGGRERERSAPDA